MTRLFPTLISLLLVINLNSQCLPGSTYMTQSDVDNFATNYPGCTEILGDLYIEPDVTSLQGLSQLTKINGWLDIWRNDNIVNLNPLQNLDTVGNIYISDCDEIQEVVLNNIKHIDGSLFISGLPKTLAISFNSLKYIGSQFGIGSIDELKILEGFDELEAIGGFTSISQCNNLINIETFGKLEILDQLSMQFCDSLADVSAFSNVNQVVALYFYDLPLFNDFSPFDSIKHLSSLTILGCDLIDTIKGFPSLDTLNNLNIHGNNNMVSIGTFPALTTMLGTILINSNPKLKDISALTKITAIDGRLHIINNITLENIDGIINIDPTTIKVPPATGMNDLEITGNSMLSDCSINSVCEFLLLPTSTYLIENNNTNCNSDIEILNNCCPTSLTIDWDPVLSGTYKSSGDIYFETNTLRADQNIILSHGQNATAVLPTNFSIEENATITIQESGCN